MALLGVVLYLAAVLAAAPILLRLRPRWFLADEAYAKYHRVLPGDFRDDAQGLLVILSFLWPATLAVALLLRYADVVHRSQQNRTRLAEEAAREAAQVAKEIEEALR